MRLTVSHSDEVAIAVGNQLRLANAKFEERIRRLAMNDTQRALYDFATTVEKAVAGIAKLFTALAGALSPPDDPDFVAVRRIYTKNGYHHEPPLHPNASPLEHLRYLAACYSLDAGFPIRVREGYASLNGVELPWHFTVTAPGISGSSIPYEEAISRVIALADGAQAERHLRGEGWPEPQDVVSCWCPDH